MKDKPKSVDEAILGLNNWMNAQHIRGINDGSIKLTPEQFRQALFDLIKEGMPEENRNGSSYADGYNRALNDNLESIARVLGVEK